MVLKASQKPDLIRATLATLNAFLSWVPLGYIFESNVIEVRGPWGGAFPHCRVLSGGRARVRTQRAGRCAAAVRRRAAAVQARGSWSSMRGSKSRPRRRRCWQAAMPPFLHPMCRCCCGCSPSLHSATFRCSVWQRYGGRGEVVVCVGELGGQQQQLPWAAALPNHAVACALTGGMIRQPTGGSPASRRRRLTAPPYIPRSPSPPLAACRSLHCRWAPSTMPTLQTCTSFSWHSWRR